MSSKDWIDITVTLKPDMNYLIIDPILIKLINGDACPGRAILRPLKQN